MKKLITIIALMGAQEVVSQDQEWWFEMPKDKQVDFIAIDEIQMCADRERGHVFTERLLNSRGQKLTMFLGSQVMANIIKDLIKDISFFEKK